LQESQSGAYQDILLHRLIQKKIRKIFPFL